MRTLFAAIVALFVSGMAYSQTSPQVAVSSEKVKVNGEVMYVHKVKGGETLFSISRAYNVTIDDIVRKNDSLKAGLKEGSTIYIPSAEAASAVAVSGESGWELSGENIRKYSKRKHTVKWYEQIGDVAKKYNVPVEAIVAFNNLKEMQLKKKQILYIPNNEFLVLMAQQQTKETAAQMPVPDEEEAAAADAREDAAKEFPPLPPMQVTETARIAYILPLNLADTLGANSNFMDFYAGALLAVNGMKEEGMKITVDLFDNIADGINPDTDFVVGPVKATDMRNFLEPDINGNYNVISPMDMGCEYLTEWNRMFIQAPVSQNALIGNLVKMYAGKCTDGNNAVVIYESGGADAPLVKATLELLDTLGVRYTAFSYGILEGRDILGKIMPLFRPQMENLVLVPSNSEAFTNDVVRNMNLLHTNPVEENRRQITLFGTAKWRNFETIEPDYFHRMNLHLSLPYFVDYSSMQVKDFLMKYRALYNSEPTPFAFQGYDITKYFLSLYRNYGKGFNRLPDLGKERMLQSTFHFVRKNSQQGGFENTSTVNIVYNKDYTVSVVE